LIPATEKLDIEKLDPGKTAECSTLLLPNIIVGGPTSMSLSLTLATKSAKYPFNVLIPFHILHVEQNHEDLDKYEFLKKWRRIPEENERKFELKGGYWSLGRQQQLQKLLLAHNIYPVEDNCTEVRSSCQIDEKTLDEGDMIPPLLLFLSLHSHIHTHTHSLSLLP
jgi:uncharacterized membrane protein YsdA (DUF1294 family)